MNIAVITPFDSANYGAYLQAYCLKAVLENMGHTVIHLRTREEAYIRNLYYKKKPVSKRDKVFPWKFRRKVAFGKRKLELFLKDQAEFQVMNPEECDPDLYILGSDEIWNINKDVFRKGIFWGRNLSPAISYAASIGDAEIEAYDKYPEIINDLRNLKAVLVRDERTKSLADRYIDAPSSLVCDPTMLLPISEYGNDLDDSYIDQNECMLIYAYYLTPGQQKEIQRCAEKLKLKTVSCCFYHDWCDYQCECTPLEFGSLIRKCKAVITTTFHGTILSILNHANFITIPTSPKTTQILAQMGLCSRAVERKQADAGRMASILSGSQVNYDVVEERLQKLRRTSLEHLKDAVEGAVCEKQGRFSYEICPADQCTGCFACMNKCPRQAIHCTVDTYGRTVPQIESAKCIKCGLCKKVCPSLHPVEKHVPLRCYAAQRREEEERRQSASGGIGAILAEQFLLDGGKVYGASVSKEGSVCHSRADQQEEGKRFRNSKYVQSDIGYSYKDVDKQLKTGKPVLFTGTPCQIAGLRSYLGRDDENLCCVDIICHGVPPMAYLAQHISSVTKGKKVNGISFRGGEEEYSLTLKKDQEVVYCADKFHDTYFHAFMKSMIFRENCYQCPYAAPARVGDLTMGDFWGLNRSRLKTEQKGKISVVLVNTKKGEKIFKSIKNSILYEAREVEEAVQGNHQLRGPAVPHKYRKKFLKAYQSGNDFERAVKEAGVHKEMLIRNFKRTRGWMFLRNTKKRLFGGRTQ